MKTGVLFVVLGLYFLTQIMVAIGYGTNLEGAGYLVGYSILPILFMIYGIYRIKKSFKKREVKNAKENQE